MNERGRKFSLFASLKGDEPIYKDKNITITKNYIWIGQYGGPISGLRSIVIKATKDTWIPYFLAFISTIAGIGCAIAIFNENYFTALFAGSGSAYGVWALVQTRRTLSLFFYFGLSMAGFMNSDRAYLEKIKAIVEEQIENEGLRKKP